MMPPPRMSTAVEPPVAPRVANKVLSAVTVAAAKARPARALTASPPRRGPATTATRRVVRERPYRRPVTSQPLACVVTVWRPPGPRAVATRPVAAASRQAPVGRALAPCVVKATGRSGGRRTLKQGLAGVPRRLVSRVRPGARLAPTRSGSVQLGITRPSRRPCLPSPSLRSRRRRCALTLSGAHLRRGAAPGVQTGTRVSLPGRRCWRVRVTPVRSFRSRQRAATRCWARERAVKVIGHSGCSSVITD